jgi:uncharacterized protein
VITGRIVTSLKQVAAADWDACAYAGGPMDNPLVSHAFLSALEDSGCVGGRTGWMPAHVVVERDGRVIGCAPSYLKTHSQGEYVFDHGWADAYERAGGRYYPKVQVAVPFTPVTGPRLLARDPADATEVREALVAALRGLRREAGASSIHVTFTEQAEQEAMAAAGFLPRVDRQFHWENRGYADFDAFLATLASRKRKAIKRERRDALANGISVDLVTGRDLTEEHWDSFFRFYMDTGARKWGRPYLTRQFFSLIGERLPDRTLLVMARREGKHIAGAINFIGNHALYGRNWGAIEEHPFLHFEVCYYRAIDFAIARGLDRVEAGAQGEHKLARGYMPAVTCSAHDIPDAGFRRAVERYLEGERAHVAAMGAALAAEGPYRQERED